MSYSLNPEELLQAVTRHQHKGSRPDLVTPYWEDKQLRFVMAAVENDDGPDWRFRMNMTAKSYRTESEQQRRRGWFPLSLASYGDDADVRYLAVWVPGRAPGTSPPPVEPVDARMLADRADKAVTSSGPQPSAFYRDHAHALNEVLDYQDIVGATSKEFKDWHDKLDPKLRTAHVTARTGRGVTLYNAVAVREKEPLKSKLLFELHPDDSDPKWQHLVKDEKFRPICLPAVPSEGPKPGWIHVSLWVKDEYEPWPWFGDFPFIIKKTREAKTDGRPIWLTGVVGHEGLGTNVILAPDQGRASEVLFHLNHNELLATIEFYQRKHWRPDVIAPYWDGDKLRCMLVVVDNSDKVDWRFCMDMSRADYEKESAQQKKLGLFPLALNSYGHEDTVRYAAIFVRYGRPSKD